VTDTPAEREDKGNWARLRRRKVVQWGLAYAAAAWTLLQVIEYLGETYAWPPAVRQIATPGFALGLLVVLVLAWYHGDQGEQSVSRPEVAILALLTVAIGGVLWWYASRLDESSWAVGAGESRTRHTVQADAASIAVLPFVDMSPGKDQEYFSDGLSEELLNLLVKVPQLRVTSRTSAFSFRGQNADIRTVAQKLNVAHVLEGSVRKSGNRVRITAQLIDARSDVQVWSETYDRTLDDVFAVQDEIAAAVVGQLQVTLLGGAAPTATRTNPEAYALYLQGKERVDSGSAEGRTGGIALLQHSLAIAPDYAPGWTQLGRTYAMQTYLGEIPLQSGAALARGAIEKALLVDPQHAPAHARLAGIELDYDWNFTSARQRLQKALALAPRDDTVLRETMDFLSITGRSDEAEKVARWMLARDPLNLEALSELAKTLHASGKYADAEQVYRQVLRQRPAASMYHYVIGETRLLRGDLAGALQEFEKEPVMPVRQLGLALAYSGLGRKRESDAMLGQLEKEHPDFSIAIAEVYAYRADPDAAFRWLARGFEERDPGMPQMRIDPLLEPLHGDPRWGQMLDRIGLSDEQIAALTLEVELP
jgi:TolB-like protein/TolA-binding protein